MGDTIDKETPDRKASSEQLGPGPEHPNDVPSGELARQDESKETAGDIDASSQLARVQDDRPLHSTFSSRIKVFII